MLLAAAAVVGAVMGVDDYIFKPFTTSVTCDMVSDVATYDNGSIIVNDYNDALMFLNADGKLVKYISKNSLLGDDSVSYVNVAAYRDNVWAQECVVTDGSLFINEERISLYSSDGEFINTIYTLKHDLNNPDDCYAEFSILDFVVDDLGGKICLVDNYNTLKILSFEPYELSEGKSLYSFDLKELGIESALISAKYFADDEVIGCVDILGNVYKINIASGTAERQIKLSEHKDTVGLDLSENGEIIPIYENPTEGREVKLSAKQILKNIFFCLSLMYLILIILAFICTNLHKIIKNKEYSHLEKIVSVITVIALAAALVIFYSHSLTEKNLADSNKAAATMAATVRDEISDNADTLLESFDLDNGIDEELFHQVTDVINRRVFISQQNGENYSISLVRYFDGGWLCVAGGYNSLRLGTLVETENYNPTPITDNSDVMVFDMDSLWGSYLTATAPCCFDDNGNPTGAIVVYKDRTDFVLERNRSNILLLIGLLTAAVGFVFLYSEIRTWIKSFAKFFAGKRHGISHPEFYLQRPMLFFSMAATIIDLSLCVLIGKDLLSSSGYEVSTFVASLPEVFGTLGMFLGVALYGILSRKFSPKKLSVLFFTIGAISYAFMFFGVKIGSFPLFAIMELLSTLGVVAGESYIVQFELIAPDEASCVEAAKDKSMVKISGGGLAGLAAGYIAEYLGNEWIYFVSCLLIIIEIILIAVLFRGENAGRLTAEDERLNTAGRSAKSGRSNILSLLLSPEMILLFVCVIVPANLAGVYKSFLFPLLASDAQIGKAIISSSTTIANVICFAAMGFVTKKVKEYGYAVSSVVSALLLAGSYFIFIFTDSIIWVFVMLIITKLISNAEGICSGMLWQNIAKKTNVSEESCSTVVRLADSAASTAKSPVAGAILGFGQNVLCVFLTAYCTVSGIVYALFKHGKAKNAKNSLVKTKK